MIISIDGDSIGKIIEGMILTNRLEQLKNFSNKVSDIVNRFSLSIEDFGGKCFLNGGDNILAFIPDSAVDKILDTISKSSEENLSFSVGLGSSVLEAYTALKIAKSNPHGCVCFKNGNQITIK